MKEDKKTEVLSDEKPIVTDDPVVDPNANNAANVTSGKGKATGYLYMAPEGTTLPTDATTDLTSDFVGLGYIDEDGITEGVETESEDKTDMNGDVILSEISSEKATWSFKFAEAVRPEVLKLIYGEANVTVDAQSGAITVHDKGASYVNKVLVREHVLSNGKRYRVIAPLAKITERGERTFKAGELVSFDTTWTLTKDVNGDRVVEYYE